MTTLFDKLKRREICEKNDNVRASAKLTEETPRHVSKIQRRSPTTTTQEGEIK
jgi:hypothetical protein